jgi:hypothetical protein
MHFFLSGLDELAAKDLIRKSAKQAGVSFNASEVESIQLMAGTLPFLLQMSAFKWFLAKRDGNSFEPKDVLKQLVNDGARFFHGWWQALDTKSRALLRQIARKENVSVTAFKILIQKKDYVS